MLTYFWSSFWFPGALIYLLNLFCNSQNPTVREETAALFAKMITDKLVGPRVRIVLSKFLPIIFMDAMRDSAEASVHMFESKSSCFCFCLCLHVYCCLLMWFLLFVYCFYVVYPDTVYLFTCSHVVYPCGVYICCLFMLFTCLLFTHVLMPVSVIYSHMLMCVVDVCCLLHVYLYILMSRLPGEPGTDLE